MVRVSVRFLAAAAIVMLACLALGRVYGLGRPASVGEPSVDELVSLLGNNPLVIKPTPMRLDIVCDPGKLEEYASWMAGPVSGESEPNARARGMHLIKLPFKAAEAVDWRERDEQGRVVRVRVPKEAFQFSWRGLEMAEEGARTEHRDQLLATLAESGVPLDAILEADGVHRPVRDLLATSLKEFHLGQGEISWTASAYIYYLPPQASWSNRLGERYTFDDLAEEIMGRPFNEESCGGTHLVSTLAKLVIADRELKFLGPGVRRRLDGYLRAVVDEAVASQAGDGSWPMRWSSKGFLDRPGYFTPETTDLARVTVTGHLLECFHLLPEALKPPRRTAQAAALWINDHLERAGKSAFVEQFCPYTHAVGSLNLAASHPTR